MAANIRAKAMLKKVRLYDINIQNKLAELDKLKCLATNITASFGTEPVSGTRNGDKIGNTVARIVDLENEVNQLVDEYVDYQKEVNDVMEQLDDPTFIQILHKHYIQDESWGEIAAELDKSYRWVCTLHGRALQNMEFILMMEERKK